ncbi:hypothetical protein CL647_00465 [bacterium]|nr:hypothetical protein [bacterium]|tara:strand:- start:102 stop:698 length:597 start_codon:yes stop_codon:yes gene_type:complete
MKKLIAAIYLVGFLGGYVEAAPNDLYDPNDPTGNISLINDIEVESIPYDLTNLHESSYTNLYIYNFTIDNNHPNGFIIEISSNNDGVLKNENPGENIEDADTLSYTISSIHNTEDQSNSGGENQTYWGFTSSYNHQNLIATSRSLENPITLTFSGATHGITQATRNFKYRILISTNSKRELFKGDLTDEITISITSIE